MVLYNIHDSNFLKILNLPADCDTTLALDFLVLGTVHVFLGDNIILSITKTVMIQVTCVSDCMH